MKRKLLQSAREMDGRLPSLAVLFSSWLLEPWKQALEVEFPGSTVSVYMYSILPDLHVVSSCCFKGVRWRARGWPRCRLRWGPASASYT